MIESIKKNYKGILIMCASSILACVGQLFWKLSAENGIGDMIIGFIFYGIGAILMIFAYRYGSLSVLQPILSLNYVFSIILAALILGEYISIVNILGVIIIIAGVLLIAGGD